MGQGEPLKFANTLQHHAAAQPRHRLSSNLLPVVLLACVCLLALTSHAQTTMPATVDAALARAGIPREAVTLMVTEAQADTPARLSHRATVPVNPASIMKLVTTFAALDALGPAFVWTTPVLADGPIQSGSLMGNLHIRGQGDPKLVLERLWLLLRRVRAMGIEHIAGDIVLDRSAFELVEGDPAEFDGEPLRPYNAAPDALLINFKSVLLTFTPQRGNNVARVTMEPPLWGVQLQSTVPAIASTCADYRAGLKADFSDANRIRFSGTYPLDCGEKQWPVAYADPKSYAARAIEGLWRELGGRLDGSVREGPMPATGAGKARQNADFASVSLAETIRDINKFSNNVMAQQLFLTLGLQPVMRDTGAREAALRLGPATIAASRDWLKQWWQDRISPGDAPTFDNGSGLSRQQRISAQALVRLLQKAYASPWMPEYIASLPITGVDGTLKSRRGAASGVAHLKTGSLRDVAGVAGYVDAASGKRYVLVAIANHANANAMRPVVDALLDWTMKDLPAGSR